MGKPSNDKERKRLEMENASFEDIVVANFYDSTQRGATIKYLIGLKVASCFCPQAEYLIKADDDTYVRLRQTEYLLTAVQNELDNEQLLQKRINLLYENKTNSKVKEQVKSHFWLNL